MKNEKTKKGLYPDGAYYRACDTRNPSCDNRAFMGILYKKITRKKC